MNTMNTYHDRDRDRDHDRCWLTEIPIELQSLILQHLEHFKDLSAFARTSYHNYQVVRYTLSALKIAVFHKQFHGLLAAASQEEECPGYDHCQSQSVCYDRPGHEPAWYRMVVVVPGSWDNSNNRQSCKRNNAPLPPANVQRRQSIMNQNASLEQIVRAPLLAGLFSLSVSSYALLSTVLAMAMAGNLHRLRRLTLNFAHPYINDPILPARYWRTCPAVEVEGTPAWNALAGLGDKYLLALRMLNLQTLSITRAAITSAQLARWIDVCRHLHQVRLDMVTGVDKSFVQRLAAAQLARKQQQQQQQQQQQRNHSVLRVLSIKRCVGLHLRTKADFKWIQDLVHTGLRQLDLRGCRNVDSGILKDFVEQHERGEWELPLELVYPEQPAGSDQPLEGRGSNFLTRPLGVGEIEVDPSYMVG